MVIEVHPVIDYSVMKLCTKPYALHPSGCPNWGRRRCCPPHAPLFEAVYDMGRPVMAVVNEYDFGAHYRKMKRLHPEWSERQLRCVLYWQGTARRQLKAEIRSAMAMYPEMRVITCPEAMGVDVTATMTRAGIALEALMA